MGDRDCLHKGNCKRVFSSRFLSVHPRRKTSSTRLHSSVHLTTVYESSNVTEDFTFTVTCLRSYYHNVVRLDKKYPGKNIKMLFPIPYCNFELNLFYQGILSFHFLNFIHQNTLGTCSPHPPFLTRGLVRA